MSENESYTGIDYFRIIAAFLVVAIHTSPLSVCGETADFVLTRIIARVAVPFFFMTSGFFLFSEYNFNLYKLKAFVKRTAIIYGISIIVYIPVNLYSGYFTTNKLPDVLKAIIFDGTFYHLWYLPASITGGVIAYLLVRKFGFKKALGFSILLYTVGLFGDSYFGLAEQFPLIKGFYFNLFKLSSYTRNGIFFAPVFFILGGIISAGKNNISLKKMLSGMAVSFSLMLFEGLFLHKLNLQRHDSMYFMLIPCMFFLFSALTTIKGQRIPALRTSSLIIYVIHPMMIILLRMAAKISGLQKILIENSLIYYAAVITASSIASIFIYLLLKKIKAKFYQARPANTERAWIEINFDSLRHNANILQKAMPAGCELMAVVKAEAYGHGATAIATCLNRIGIKAFAVATIDEGIKLRHSGIRGEILIMGYTDPSRAKEMHRYNLIQTLIDYDYAVLLNEQGYKIKAHIKIDTGMHRLGFSDSDIPAITRIFKAKHLNICGIYTHLCESDSLSLEAVDFTHKQIESFYRLLETLSREGIVLPKKHIQSSYGLLNYPELKCDYVRIGIALYGVLSSNTDKTNLQPDLRPVLSLKSKVALTREVAVGESVGYGREFVAERNSRVALLPIGYADGIPRALSCGNAEVLLRGCRAPIIGRICMDQLAVDITDIPDVTSGDIATLIGIDGTEEIRAADVAESTGTITNELLSRMGNRIRIVPCPDPAPQSEEILSISKICYNQT
jgi:serine/alanine racemase